MRLLNLTIQKLDEVIDNTWLSKFDNVSTSTNNHEIHCKELNLCCKDGKYQLLIENQLVELKNNIIILLEKYKINVSLKDIQNPRDTFQNSPLNHIISADDRSRYEITNEQSLSSLRDENMYTENDSMKNSLDFIYNGQPSSELSAQPAGNFRTAQTEIYDDQEIFFPLVRENEPIEHDFIPILQTDTSGFFSKSYNFFGKKIIDRIKSFFPFLFVILLFGCANSELNEIDRMEITINTAKDLNPDVDGSSSPVVVMLFQLKQTSKFAKAEYFELYNNAEKVLSDTYIKKFEVEVRPGRQVSKTIDLSPESKYIGILAAFRDISAHWKEIIEINEEVTDNFILNLKHFTIENIS